MASRAAERLLAGAIDMHVHSAPDIRPRKLDDRALVSRAESAGLAGVVLKNHFTPTTDRAHALRPSVRIGVFGSIVLNEHVGGLDPLAAETALRLGAKVVWMPTVSAAHHAERTGEAVRGRPLRIAEDGRVVDPVAEILALTAAAGAVVASGHVSPRESAVLVRAAREAGVRGVVITHPASWLVGMSVAQQVELARAGATIEIAYVVTRQRTPVTMQELAGHARAIGAASVILTTDLGQPENPYPVEGFAEIVQGMLDGGLSAGEVEAMVRVNPAQLLGLAGAAA